MVKPNLPSIKLHADESSLLQSLLSTAKFRITLLEAQVTRLEKKLKSSEDQRRILLKRRLKTERSIKKIRRLESVALSKLVSGKLL